MIYFIGNSFCRLCQSSRDALVKELDICSKGLACRGLLLVKHGASARLPGEGSVIFHDGSTAILECIYDDEEIDLHTRVYKNRPDVNSILHVKSPIIYAATKDGMIDTVHAEATLVLSDIVLTEDNSPSNISKAAVGEPLRPIRIIICKDEVYSIGACIHESRAFMEIMDEWARVKAISNALGGARYPITLERLRSVGSRYVRAIKFGGRIARL